MKKTIPALLLILCTFAGCEQEESIKLPPCIRKQIEAEELNCCTNLTVVRHLTKIGHVYRFNRNIGFDESSPVFDSECNLLCFVGGFAGTTDCDVNGVPLKLVGDKVVWE